MKNLIKNLEDLYKKGDFDQGIEILKSNQAKFEPGVFHYNLGTFFVKKGELALGRYHLELAKDNGFQNSMLEHNLKVTKNNLGVLQVEKPTDFLNQVLDLNEAVSKDYFLGIFLLFLFLSTLVFRKSKSLILSLAFLIIGIAPVGLSTYLKSQFTKGIVVTDTSIYDGPSEIYDEIGELPKGLKLYMTMKRDNSWYFIEYPEAFRGWVDYSTLNILRDKKDVF